MTPEQVNLIHAILIDTSVYQQAGDIESMRVIAVPVDIETEELVFHAEGEESGEEYEISFDEVDLENDIFYELKTIDISRYTK